MKFPIPNSECSEMVDMQGYSGHIQYHREYVPRYYPQDIYYWCGVCENHQAFHCENMAGDPEAFREHLESHGNKLWDWKVEDTSGIANLQQQHYPQARPLIEVNDEKEQLS
jgi:hypothetical protein